jgi:16S rRNA C1402 N4-methylase RsmH
MLAFTAAPHAVPCRRGAAAQLRAASAAAPRAGRAAAAAGAAAAAPAVPHVPVLLPQILSFFEGRPLNVRVRHVERGRLLRRAAAAHGGRFCRAGFVARALTRRLCPCCPSQCFVDATLGAGGHASAMLAAHPVRPHARSAAAANRDAPKTACHTLTPCSFAMRRAHRTTQELRVFVGIDQDPTAHSLAQARVSAAAPPGAAVHFVRRNFREFGAALDDAALPPASVDGALFDLGMSSMQARRSVAAVLRCRNSAAAAASCVSSSPCGGRR